MTTKNKLAKEKKGVYTAAFSGLHMPKMKGEVEDDTLQDILNRLEDLEANVTELGSDVINISNDDIISIIIGGGAIDWGELWEHILPGPGITIIPDFIFANPDTDHGLTWGSINGYPGEQSIPFRIAEGDGLYVNNAYRWPVNDSSDSVDNIRPKNAHPVEIYLGQNYSSGTDEGWPSGLTFNPIQETAAIPQNPVVQGFRPLRIDYTNGLRLNPPEYEALWGNWGEYFESGNNWLYNSLGIRFADDGSAPFACGLQIDPRQTGSYVEDGKRGLMVKVWQKGGLEILPQAPVESPGPPGAAVRDMRTSGLAVNCGDGLGIKAHPGGAEYYQDLGWVYDPADFGSAPLYNQLQVEIYDDEPFQFKTKAEKDLRGVDVKGLFLNISSGLAKEPGVDMSSLTLNLGHWLVDQSDEKFGLDYNVDTQLVLRPEDWLYVLTS